MLQHVLINRQFAPAINMCVRPCNHACVHVSNLFPGYLSHCIQNNPREKFVHRLHLMSSKDNIHIRINSDMAIAYKIIKISIWKVTCCVPNVGQCDLAFTKIIPRTFLFCYFMQGHQNIFEGTISKDCGSCTKSHYDLYFELLLRILEHFCCALQQPICFHRQPDISTKLILQFAYTVHGVFLLETARRILIPKDLLGVHTCRPFWIHLQDVVQTCFRKGRVVERRDLDFQLHSLQGPCGSRYCPAETQWSVGIMLHTYIHWNFHDYEIKHASPCPSNPNKSQASMCLITLNSIVSLMLCIHVFSMPHEIKIMSHSHAFIGHGEPSTLHQFQALVILLTFIKHHKSVLPFLGRSQ